MYVQGKKPLLVPDAASGGHWGIGACLEFLKDGVEGGEVQLWGTRFSSTTQQHSNRDYCTDQIGQ